MDWTRERWIKLYTRDSGDWLFLSFDAQALFLMLLRKVDRRGCLALGKNGKAALAVVLGHGATQDVTRIAAALEVLIVDRSVIVDGEALLIPNFETAQLARTSDAERSRRKREKSESVTRRHSKTRKVTAGHDLEENRTDKKRREEKENAQSDAPHPPAPASEFQQFVIKHWPDVDEPAVREAEWRDACPGIDLLAESKKALSWENETPRHRKTDHGKFLGNWFRRAQDNGSRAGLQTFDQKRQQDRVEVFGSLLKGAQNGVDAGGAQPDRLGAGDHNGAHGRDVQQRDGAILPARARVVPG